MTLTMGVEKYGAIFENPAFMTGRPLSGRE
jgi:hypothetical protein